jgi:ubiquitin-conjugating enzyme E2 M
MIFQFFHSLSSSSHTHITFLYVFSHSCHFVFAVPPDIGELDGGKVATVSFPNPNDLTSFNVTVRPDTGYWAGATYEFVFTIPPHYPHSPPKVECRTKIYHPNIDLEGKVCLNILREDWRPVLDINSVIYGLIYLFYEPNPVSLCVCVLWMEWLSKNLHCKLLYTHTCRAFSTWVDLTFYVYCCQLDPLNHEAADLFRKDIHQFERLVNRTLRGGLLDGVYFARLV